MSHKEQLAPKKHPYKMRFGQKSLTHFKDYRKSIRIRLVEPESKETMMKRLYQFVRTTWEDDVNDNANPTEKQMQEGLEAMLSGQALGLGLEATQLTFEISGITRVDLQQIVRQRVGVTFSVQCTGDRDIRHNPILIEESITQDSDLLDSIVHSTLETKKTYSKLMDSFKVSIQGARLALPESREMHMRMHTNLSTFLFFHQKRIDDSSQTWQMNEIVRKMAEEICKVYPEMETVIKKNSKKFTMAKDAESNRASTFATALYLPKEDTYDYHGRDYLYGKTKEEFNFTNTPIEDTYYWDDRDVSKLEYDAIKKKYDNNDLIADERSMSNEEILKMNLITNEEIANEIL